MKRCLVFSLILSTYSMVFLLAQGDLPPEVIRYADAVFYNGQFLTCDENFTVAEAIAIRDSKIMALGDRGRLLRMAGPQTRKIDLGGKTVVPGFFEVHPVISNTPGGHGPRGPVHLGSEFISFEDVPTGLKKIKEKAYGRTWEKSAGWALVTAARTAAAYQLNKDLLDSVVPDRPLLVTFDNTMGVVNSEGLKRLPPELLGMGIFKDENGQPNGHIRGWAYGVLTYDLLPWPEGEDFEKLVGQQKAIFRLFNKLGVTSFGGRVNGLVTTVLHTLWKRKELTVRVRVVSEIARLNPHLEPFLKRIGNLMDVGDEWFKIVGTTVGSIDGVTRYGGVLTVQPKRGEPPGAGAFGPFGENKWEGVVQAGDHKEKGEYRNFVLASRYDWNVNDIHVMGDRGMDMVVEAMKEADKINPLKGKRFGMVHGLMRRPDQLELLVFFGAKLSLSPRYLFMERNDVDNLTLQYGADALHGYTPVAAALELGLHPVLESNDYVGNISSWFSMIEAFVTRKHPQTGKVIGPDQRVNRKDALKMSSIWAAEFYGDEKIAGSLEVDKVADFVVIDKNYMAIPEDDISEIKVLATILGGRVVYDQLGLAVALE